MPGEIAIAANVLAENPQSEAVDLMINRLYADTRTRSVQRSPCVQASH